jgi:hypothetical protein
VSTGLTNGNIFGWYLPENSGQTENGNEFTFGFDAQIGQGHFNQNRNVFFKKGKWTRLEFYVEINSPGQNNGVWRMWIDGQLATEYTNLRMYSGGTGQAYYRGIRFDGTRGCGASAVATPAGGQVRKYNRLAFYGSTN